ncbi:hypothetical protein CYMTET_54328 [Cymbomonas tetramitiformis]|uniref:Uncharacterized protein n=1 Tax=Cymbomonas tetramitiformis TaxID=36881 RepID=A0AAE0BFG0_9CHLO|nr:hypothetical protein CYMTET_54328 [Cymbomonas tetramitiformis]
MPALLRHGTFRGVRRGQRVAQENVKKISEQHKRKSELVSDHSTSVTTIKGLGLKGLAGAWGLGVKGVAGAWGLGVKGVGGRLGLGLKGVDEIATAWCTVPIPDVTTMSGEKSVEAKLVAGKLYEPAKVEPPTVPGAGNQGIFKRMCRTAPQQPILYLKFRRIPVKELETVRLLPPQIILEPSLVPIMLTFRHVLAERLYNASGDVHGDRQFQPILAVFPQLMDDPQLFAALVSLWSRETARLGSQRKDQTKRLEALRACVLRVWPLLHFDRVPPGSLSSDLAHAEARTEVIRSFLKDRPVQALSHKADEWICRPFDVSELSYRYRDNHGL